MRIENYSITELLHLSFVIRDTLEYCYEKFPVKEEMFEQRYKMISQLLDEKNFIARFLINNPNEQGKLFYENLQKYFNNIYVNGNYVDLNTEKVDPDKKVEMLEETIKNYQTVADVITGFLKNLKDKNVVEKEVEDCANKAENFFRILYLFILYNTILREDSNYKLSLRETKNKDSYECKYILSTLKSLISLYNFNRQKYSGEEDEIKAVFEEIFRTFQKLDGTIKVKDKEELENSIKQANLIISQNLRKYEIAWKESYSKLITLLKNNPVDKAEIPQKPEA